MTTEDTRANGGSDGIDRRDVLKLVGTGAATVSVASGVASANPHMFQFFGCSQVCSDTDGNKAVVAVDGGYECRRVVTESDRNNVPWGGKTYCYEVSGDESIVGVLEEDECCGQGEGCALCMNPNNCAGNYYEDPGKVLSKLKKSTCGACESVDITIGGCTVYGSSGGGGNGDKGRGNGNGDKGRGNGNGNKGRGNGNG